LYRRKLNTRTPEPETESDNKKLKLVIISSLGLLLIILFYFYISFGSDESDEINEVVISKPVSKEDLIKDIDSIFYTFGIQQNWIKEKTSKNKNDEHWISKEVKIPNDLQTIDLNYELTNYLRSKTLKEKVVEDPKTRNLFIEIYSIKDTVRQTIGDLKIIYSDSIKRNASDVCIVLDSLEYYTLPEVQEILTSAETYSLFLPLRNDKADYQSAIMEANEDYLVEFLIGDENEVIADFKTDMKESFWKSKVKSAAMNYPKAAGVILKSNPGLSEFEDKVKDEFLKNNMKVYKDTVFTQFRGGEQIVNTLFESISTNASKEKRNLIYSVNLNLQDFKEFERKVYQLKKLGYRFYKFSDIMKKIETEKNKLKTDTK
jgi:hypothetical protein